MGIGLAVFTRPILRFRRPVWSAQKAKQRFFEMCESLSRLPISRKTHKIPITRRGEDDKKGKGVKRCWVKEGCVTDAKRVASPPHGVYHLATPPQNVARYVQVGNSYCMGTAALQPFQAEEFEGWQAGKTSINCED